MRTAIYLNDGARQVVLTPENEFEVKCCEMLCGIKSGGGLEPNWLHADVFRGKFSDCRRNYIREYNATDDLIIRLYEEKPDDHETEA